LCNPINYNSRAFPEIYLFTKKLKKNNLKSYTNVTALYEAM